MLIIFGDNLGERQKNLNFKVNEAFEHKLNVENVKDGDLKSNDIEIIYKIDLAAKTKNIDYILKKLKSGDALYISRALKKCTWLGDQEFKNIINPTYLNCNIFPVMSLKMKKKCLNTLPMYLKNDEIVIDFYKWCLKNKLLNEASKFLIIAPESFKIQVLLENNGLPKLGTSNRDDYIKHFVKNSFILVEKYLEVEKISYFKSKAMTSLSYLYAESSEKYLDLMETYNLSPKLGNRITKDVLKKYKDRVLRKPTVYINSLSKLIIIKRTSVEDAKSYLTILLRSYKSADSFEKFYSDYIYVINTIPKGERFNFIKKIFLEKYPDKPFETDKRFYTLKFYDMMNDDEKEAWALSHIESGDEILGSNKDYLWYKFVNFDKAFKEIKNLIHITPDKNLRLTILKVLIESAKTSNDIEVLLKYFYERHINESARDKENFVTTLNETHALTEFNEKCWKALEKILYSLEIFTILDYYHYTELRNIVLWYYIIHGYNLPDVLKQYIDRKQTYHMYDLKNLCKKDEQKQKLIYDYLLYFFVDKVETYSKMQLDEDNKRNIITNTKNILNILKIFDKTKNEIPDIILKFIKLYPKEFENHELLAQPQFTRNDVNRYLKQDASLLVTEFPKIEANILHQFGTINWVIRKLGLYFEFDIGKQFLNLLNECLSKNDVLRISKVAVYGIYILADESFKIDFLKKYVPTDPKIDHVNISRNLLYVQQAICGLVHYSRPSIPLKYYLPYLTGDYVASCLPVFNAYRMKLPTPLCLGFVAAIIEKPISIQKHGIRLAFQCFSIDDLVKLVENVWKKTNNVSLRKVIYCNLFNKTVNENTDKQANLFELLKTLTSSLNQDDDSEVFDLVHVGNLPNAYISEYLMTGWTTVTKFPVRTVNIERATRILQKLEKKIHVIPDKDIDTLITDFVNEILEFEPLNPKLNELKNLRDGKLSLIQMYLVFITNTEQSQIRNNLIKHILHKSFTLWDKISNNTFVAREFINTFLYEVRNKNFCNNLTNFIDPQCMYYITTLFEEILNNLLSFPQNEVYFYALIWEYRLNVIVSKIIADSLNGTSLTTIQEIQDAVKESIKKLASAFGNLVKTYISEGKFYELHRDRIKCIVDSKIGDLRLTIVSYWLRNIKGNVAFEKDDAITLFCKELLKFESRQIIIFAVCLLDSTYPENSVQDYKSVIEKLKAIKDGEIQSFQYVKFVIGNNYKLPKVREEIEDMEE